MAIKLTMKYLLSLLTIYIFSVLLIGVLQKPFFIVNDEWSSFRQIDAFHAGIFRLNAQKDTPFILQGLLAFATDLIFHNTFFSVRLLNLFITLIFLAGLFLLLREKLKKDKTAFIVSLILIFNPLLYFLSLVFYSEIYFLALLVWGLYFLYKKKMLLSSIVLGALVLVRQQGILVPVSFVILKILKNKRISKDEIMMIISTIFFTLIYGLWPTYISWEKEYVFSGFVKLFRDIDTANSPTEYNAYLFIPVYLASFIFAIIKINKINVITILSTVALVGVIAQNKVFAIGQMITIKGIYGEDYAHIFENKWFIGILSLLFAFALTQLFQILVKKVELDDISKMCVLASVLFIFSNLAISDIYDRYLIIPIILFIIGYTGYIIEIKPVLLMSFIPLLFFTLVTTKDYITIQQIRYELAYSPKIAVKDKQRILVDDAFGKYHKSKSVNDFTGMLYVHPEKSYQCEVNTTDELKFKKIIDFIQYKSWSGAVITIKTACI